MPSNNPTAKKVPSTTTTKTIPQTAAIDPLTEKPLSSLPGAKKHPYLLKKPKLSTRDWMRLRDPHGAAKARRAKARNDAKKAADAADAAEASDAVVASGEEGDVSSEEGDVESAMEGSEGGEAESVATEEGGELVKVVGADIEVRAVDNIPDADTAGSDVNAPMPTKKPSKKNNRSLPALAPKPTKPTPATAAPAIKNETPGVKKPKRRRGRGNSREAMYNKRKGELMLRLVDLAKAVEDSKITARLHNQISGHLDWMDRNVEKAREDEVRRAEKAKGRREGEGGVEVDAKGKEDGEDVDMESEEEESE